MTGIIHFPPSSRRSRGVTRRTMLAGAAVCAAATVFGPAALAQPGATPDATPVAEPNMGLFPGEARQRLNTMLSILPPGMMGGPDPNTWLFSWLDLQAHLTALGSPDPYAGTTDMVAITSPLVTQDPLFIYAMDEEARELFGFLSFDVHQILVAGAAPDEVTYYAGGLPVESLPAVWEAAGYERRSGDAGDFWTIGENGELDLASPIGSIATVRMNNLAILDGGIVVCARTSAQVQQVQDLAVNGGSSAADDENLATLVSTMPADAVNLVAVRGAGLEAITITPENPGMDLSRTTADLLAESDDAARPMPPIEMALFGITAGVSGADPVAPQATPLPAGGPNGRFFVNLLTGSGVDAAAVAEVVAWRIEHMTSPVSGYVYSDLLTPEFTGEDAVQGDVAALTFTSPQSLTFWVQMLMIQDLWPFVWLDGA